ncbi:MAG: protease complex subunit PrcB family protein [Planctomycetota bacterium]
MRSLLMKMLMVAVLVAPLGLAACKNGGGSGGGSGLAQPVPIVESVTGTSGILDQPGAMLFTSQKDLDAMGASSIFPGEIDFKKYDMVVMAAGEVPTGGYWVRIKSISQVGDDLYVAGVANKPGPDDEVTQMMEFPYQAVLVEKTGAKLAIADVTSVTGQSPDLD